MKKSRIKFLALMLTVIFIAATFTIYSSAAITRNEWEYTAKTNTSGLSSLYLSGIPGNYYYYNAYARGGQIADFLTTLDMWFSNYEGYYQSAILNSDTEGSRILEKTFSDDDPLTYYIRTAYSITQFDSTSKTDSSDYWFRGYVYYWLYDFGWSTNRNP